MKGRSMAGYSGTPLAKKLGIKGGSSVFVKNAPADYLEMLEPLPEGVRFAKRLTSGHDIVHVFTSSKAELENSLPTLMDKIQPDGAIWVSWPKKVSKVPTDITEDVIRDVALPLGLVDVKVCAVNDVWSGLKLVIRKDLRR